MSTLKLVPKIRTKSRSQTFFVEKLELQDGDVLVVRCAEVLCRDQAEQMLAYLKPMLPAGVKALILDRGMSVGVIRKAAT